MFAEFTESCHGPFLPSWETTDHVVRVLPVRVRDEAVAGLPVERGMSVDECDAAGHHAQKLKSLSDLSRLVGSTTACSGAIAVAERKFGRNLLPKDGLRRSGAAAEGLFMALGRADCPEPAFRAPGSFGDAACGIRCHAALEGFALNQCGRRQLPSLADTECPWPGGPASSQSDNERTTAVQGMRTQQPVLHWCPSGYVPPLGPQPVVRVDSVLCLHECRPDQRRAGIDLKHVDPGRKPIGLLFQSKVT